MDDKIYLCYQYKNDNNINCTLFKSFIEADHYYDTNIHNTNIHNSTMINICKYSPIIFDKYILDFKIKKIFFNIKIKNKK